MVFVLDFMAFRPFVYKLQSFQRNAEIVKQVLRIVLIDRKVKKCELAEAVCICTDTIRLARSFPRLLTVRKVINIYVIIIIKS